MKWIDKVLAAVLSVLAILFGVALLFAVIGFPLDTAALQRAVGALDGPGVALVLCFFALLLIGIGVRLLIVQFRKPAESVQHVLVRESESGSAYLSTQAISDLVTRFLTTQATVKNDKVQIGVENGGVIISVSVEARPDVSIPVLTESLQTQIRSEVENCGGISVSRVEISVEALDASSGKHVV